MKTLISTFAIVIALTCAIAAQPKIDYKNQKSNSGRFSFSQLVNNRPSQNKTSIDEVKTKMINKGPSSFSHNADTLTTWTYDENTGNFVISERKYYIYENGVAKEIITEIPSESGYELKERESFTYNSNNLIAENVLYFYNSDAMLWQPYQKLEYIYNNDDVMIKEIHSSWNPDINDWVAYYKYKEEYTYNENNYLVSIEGFYWSLSTDTGQFFPSFKEEFVYDDLGRLSLFTFSIPNGLELEPTQIEEYYYQGDNIMQDYVLVYNKNNNEWVLEFKISDISWYKFEENLIESFTVYTSEDWDDDWKEEVEWYEHFRYSFQYHPANDMVIMIMEEFFFINEWHPGYREITELNEFLHITRFEEQFYYGSWETDFGFDYNWKYNEENNPFELTVMYYDSWEANFWQYLKYFSFGYYKETESGIVSNPSLENTFSIYPNPAKDILNINASNSNEFTKVAIYDISGTLVKTHSFSGNITNSTINISDLRQGIYFVRISRQNNAQVYKLIKQ